MPCGGVVEHVAEQPREKASENTRLSALASKKERFGSSAAGMSEDGCVAERHAKRASADRKWAPVASIKFPRKRGSLDGQAWLFKTAESPHMGGGSAMIRGGWVALLSR